MNHQKFLQKASGLGLFLMLLAGCSAPATTPDSLVISPINAAQVIELTTIELDYITPYVDSYNVVWSPDSKMLLVTESSGFHRYLVESGEKLPAIHTSNSQRFVLSPDGQILANGGWGKTELWEVSTGQLLNTLVHEVEYASYSPMSIAISPDGLSIATASVILPDARLWDLQTGKLIRTFEPEGQQLGVQQVFFSSDGYKLVTVDGFEGIGGLVRLWEVQSGQLLQTFTLPEQEAGQVLFRIGWVRLSPDGQMLVMNNYEDQALLLWNVETGQLLDTITEVSFDGITFSPDGHTLILISEPNDCQPPQISNSSTGQPFQILEGCSGVFSPAGQIQVTVDGKKVQLRDVSTGQLLHTLESHSDVLQVAFSPDGYTISSLSDDGLVQLWGIKP